MHKWLELGDENFILAIQNKASSEKQLATLRHQRATQLIGILGIFLLELLGMIFMAIFEPSAIFVVFGGMTSLIAVCGLNYMSLDTQIKMIRMAISLKATKAKESN